MGVSAPPRAGGTSTIKRTLLFDLDGTLTDPKPGITRCIGHALECLDYPVPHLDDLVWCIGPPLPASFAKLLNVSDPELIRRAVAHYRERFSTIGLYENAVFAGIPQALRELKDQGYELRIATSKPQVFARRIVDHFDLAHYFVDVHGSEFDGTRDDKGELIGWILTEHGVSKTNTLMIGDRQHDVIGARKQAIPCLGVTYGYGDQEELQSAGANAIVHRPEEIPDAVRAWFGTA